MLAVARHSTVGARFTRIVVRACATSASEVSFTVDESNFRAKVLESDKPVVVQAHATWCQPCKALKPRLQKAVEAHNGGMLLATLDVDASPSLAQALHVTGVPAVFAVHKRKILDKFVGLQPEDTVAEFVDRFLKNATGGEGSGGGGAGSE